METLRERKGIKNVNTPDIPTQDIAQMVEFILKNVFFLFFILLERLKNINQEKQLVPNSQLLMLAFS